jgi:putative NIF3 family GTP cyclohydrolase 1 type 2
MRLSSSFTQHRFLTGFLVATAAILPAYAQTPPVTARTLIAQIVAANAAPPVPNTVDTIKAGDPDTPVTGIATTFMDTYEVLQKAVAAGDNLIITHEPTFYNHVDDRTLFPGDPVVAAKLAYINAHHLVVWRFHDGWHRHQPDGILDGEVTALGWASYQQTGPATDPHLFHLPPTTVGALAATLQAQLSSPVVRVVGDPATPVTNVALLPGASGLVKQVAMLERADVQVLVAGESAEWEAVEYVRDAAALARAGKGEPKALILLGHEPSEEAGMRYCATWLRTILPGIKIDFIPAGSPFTAVATARH